MDTINNNSATTVTTFEFLPVRRGAKINSLNYLFLSLLLLFSENLFMQMADRIAEDGYQKAGYQYICIDVST